MPRKSIPTCRHAAHRQEQRHNKAFCSPSSRYAVNSQPPCLVPGNGTYPGRAVVRALATLFRNHRLSSSPARSGAPLPLSSGQVNKCKREGGDGRRGGGQVVYTFSTPAMRPQPKTLLFLPDSLPGVTRDNISDLRACARCLFSHTLAPAHSRACGDCFPSLPVRRRVTACFRRARNGPANNRGELILLINGDTERYVRASTSEERAESRESDRSLAASSPAGISVAIVLFVYDVSTASGTDGSGCACTPGVYRAREVPLEELCVFYRSSEIPRTT